MGLGRQTRQAGNKAVLPLQALNVCIALVERRRLWEVAHGSGLASTPADTDRALEVQAVETLAPHLPRLFSHLSERQAGKTQVMPGAALIMTLLLCRECMNGRALSGNSMHEDAVPEGADACPQETPHGLLQPPLGSGRLTVVALLAVLLRTGLPAAEEAVMKAHLLRLCLSLFADYPFNSILHHQVRPAAAAGNLPWMVQRTEGTQKAGSAGHLHHQQRAGKRQRRPAGLPPGGVRPADLAGQSADRSDPRQLSS